MIGVVVGIFVVIEGFFRSLLMRVGVPGNLQQAALLVLDVVLIVGIVRIFGGVLRALLVVCLILLLLHIVVPALGR